MTENPDIKCFFFTGDFTWLDAPSGLIPKKHPIIVHDSLVWHMEGKYCEYMSCVNK